MLGTLDIIQCTVCMKRPSTGFPSVFLRAKTKPWVFFILHVVKKIMYMYMFRKLFWQGSKKVPSSGPGQVDFVAGQVTFKADLHNKQRSRQSWITKEIIK